MDRYNLIYLLNELGLGQYFKPETTCITHLIKRVNFELNQ